MKEWICRELSTSTGDNENGVLMIETELIRCKDCKHRDPEDHKCDCGHDIIWQTPRPDNFYCADGERRPGKEKQYFPKGFFSKERPLAKGEEDEAD